LMHIQKKLTELGDWITLGAPFWVRMGYPLSSFSMMCSPRLFYFLPFWFILFTILGCQTGRQPDFKIGITNLPDHFTLTIRI
jgi:hypothetical protein